MPRHCSAGGCSSRDTKETRIAGVTFHRLPKRGDPRRATWILNSFRKGPGGIGQWEPQSDFVYFCSKHFTPESFEVTGVSGYHRLKDDAIPTRIERSPSRITRRKSKPWKKTLEKQTSADEPSLSKSLETQTRDSPVQTMAQDQPLDLTLGSPSPSCYMKRLPPPGGFYVAKEHSYALVYPLVWRRSYEKAILSLQKALRLLNATRRRESRLRLALARLRESRVRKTSSHNPDQSKEGVDPKQSRSELEVASEEIFSEEERLTGAGQPEKLGTEDEEGYCFYCGRAREDEDTKENGLVSGTRTPLESSEKASYLQMLHLHFLQQDVQMDADITQGGSWFLVPSSDGQGGTMEGMETEPELEDASGIIEMRSDEVAVGGQNCHGIKVCVVGGDIKQKLKEHLEGFQLQLSNEFTD